MLRVLCVLLGVYVLYALCALYAFSKRYVEHRGPQKRASGRKLTHGRQRNINNTRKWGGSAPRPRTAHPIVLWLGRTGRLARCVLVRLTFPLAVLVAFCFFFGPLRAGFRCFFFPPLAPPLSLAFRGLRPWVPGALAPCGWASCSPLSFFFSPRPQCLQLSLFSGPRCLRPWRPVVGLSSPCTFFLCSGFLSCPPPPNPLPFLFVCVCLLPPPPGPCVQCGALSSRVVPSFVACCVWCCVRPCSVGGRSGACAVVAHVVLFVWRCVVVLLPPPPPTVGQCPWCCVVSHVVLCCVVFCCALRFVFLRWPLVFFHLVTLLMIVCYKWPCLQCASETLESSSSFCPYTESG